MLLCTYIKSRCFQRLFWRSIYSTKDHCDIHPDGKGNSVNDVDLVSFKISAQYMYNQKPTYTRPEKQNTNVIRYPQVLIMYIRMWTEQRLSWYLLPLKTPHDIIDETSCHFRCKVNQTNTRFSLRMLHHQNYIFGLFSKQDFSYLSYPSFVWL